ncbi:hypothetical protein, partial [Belliella pelovolcani]|uniref:hypothetical protein n=1 Tax=Belliella pelovolcani TaxID=529505 RepID=UPI00391D14C7
VSFPFLLSFWAKSFTGTGTVTANGESTSIGGTWQFITRIITSRDLQTISGNNVMIDDLRLHPLASKIRTYTHRPFIGMSSISEFDGTVQRYQYDTKNRLWRVFDDKGNILSQFEYKYKSGPSF